MVSSCPPPRHTDKARLPLKFSVLQAVSDIMTRRYCLAFRSSNPEMEEHKVALPQILLKFSSTLKRLLRELLAARRLPSFVFAQGDFKIISTLPPPQEPFY